MSTLDLFRRDVEAVKTVAFERYDHLAPAHEELRSRLAWIHDNTVARGWAEIIKLEDELGPKPALYVLDQEAVLEAINDNRVPNGYFAVGMEKIFGVKPGVPSTTLQIRPQPLIQ